MMRCPLPAVAAAFLLISCGAPQSEHGADNPRIGEATRPGGGERQPALAEEGRGEEEDSPPTFSGSQTVQQALMADREPLETQPLDPTILRDAPSAGYLEAETWLTADGSPDGTRLVLVSSSAVELYAMPDFELLWSTPLAADSAYGIHGLFDRPLVAFSKDGGTIGWLSGRPAGEDTEAGLVFVLLDADSGSVQTAVRMEALTLPKSPGPTQGQPAPANPNWLGQGSNEQWIFGSHYQLALINLDSLTASTLQSSTTGTWLNAHPDGWQVEEEELVHEDGRGIPTRCQKRFARLDVSSQLQQAAVQCMAVGAEAFRVFLLDLQSEQELANWPAPNQVNSVPLVLADGYVLLIERPTDRGDVMTLHLLHPDGTHDERSFGAE